MKALSTDVALPSRMRDNGAMVAQLIDGKAEAAHVRERVKQRAEAFEKAHGRRPSLQVVLVGEDPASQVYVRNKERAAEKTAIAGRAHRLPTDTDQRSLEELVRELNDSEEVDGVLVQLPLPEHLDSQPVLDLIDPRKDVDGLHPTNAGLLLAGREGLRPCTPLGCMHLIEKVRENLGGMSALVVGRSNLVGKPISLMLLQRHATVTMAHSRTKNLDERARASDIVVAAAGRAGLVRGEWIKPGAIVIDVGINRTDEGKLTGDVDFEGARERGGHITPVPGGVGPMTIAMLLQNTVAAAERRMAEPAAKG